MVRLFFQHLAEILGRLGDILGAEMGETPVEQRMRSLIAQLQGLVEIGDRQSVGLHHPVRDAAQGMDGGIGLGDFDRLVAVGERLVVHFGLQIGFATVREHPGSLAVQFDRLGEVGERARVVALARIGATAHGVGRR